MWYGYEKDDCFERVPRVCLCIGPDKCCNGSCPQVQAYRKRKKCIQKKIDKIVFDTVSKKKNDDDDEFKKRLARIAHEMKTS